MTRTKVPKVSVILPVYNAGAYVGEVLATILEQSFDDFEVVVIDDGSKDDSASTVKKYAAMDKRVHYYYQKNRGGEKLGTTLNYGVSLARAELIARADSDDPWMLDRLEKQVAYLDGHPECVVVGGGAEIMDGDGRHIWTLISPSRDEEIRRTWVLHTPINHGGVCFRKKAFYEAGEYRDEKYVEDFDLWVRMGRVGELHNLPEAIFRYRRNTTGISISNEKAQKLAVEGIGREQWKEKTPTFIGVGQLRKKLRELAKRRNGGLLGWEFLESTLGIGIKYAKWDKKPAKGLFQALAVAASSMAGLRIVRKKVWASARRVVLYGIFGALTTFVNFVTYLLFAKMLGVDMVVSNGIAWVVAVAFAFVTNRQYVFESTARDRKSIAREAVAFMIFRVLSGAVEIAGFAFFVNMLLLDDIVVKIASMFVIIVLNYAFSKFFVFKRQ